VKSKRKYLAGKNHISGSGFLRIEKFCKFIKTISAFPVTNGYIRLLSFVNGELRKAMSYRQA